MTDQPGNMRVKMRRNNFVAGAIAAIAGFLTPPSAIAQSAPDYAAITIPLRIEKVEGKPIYYSVGSPGVPGPLNEGNTSNAAFVITDEGVVVFDALGTPSHGWALLKEIRSRTEKPVRYVVVSHYHADHIYGLQAFADHTDAIIIAHEKSLEYNVNPETADEKAGERLDQRREALAPWVDRNTRVVPADIVFTGRLTFSLGGKRFILNAAGPAHASSDIIMLDESERVLFAGDVVQNGRIPFLNSEDVDTAMWLTALEQVKRLDPSFIIPGHGRPSTKAAEGIAFTRDYILYLRKAMAAGVENWADFETTYEQADWSTYRGVTAFESNNRGNAYRVFLELEREALAGARP